MTSGAKNQGVPTHERFIACVSQIRAADPKSVIFTKGTLASLTLESLIEYDIKRLAGFRSKSQDI